MCLDTTPDRGRCSVLHGRDMVEIPTSFNILTVWYHPRRMAVKPRKTQYAEQTRRALLKAARTLFAKRGYADTPIEDVVRRARVTRGALYHHFRDKRALFEAVYEDVLREQLEAVNAAVEDVLDPWSRFQSGLASYLDSCVRPDVQRIALLEAPSVLGWEVWREIDEKYSLGIIHTGLQRLMDAKIIRAYPVDLLVKVLVGALIEAAMAIARADDPASTRAEAGEVIQAFLASLRAEP